jgi:hypothetical protein
VSATTARYGIVRDQTIGGIKCFDVCILGRSVDKGGEWDWPRFMVRYMRHDVSGKFEREVYERAINPDDIFASLQLCTSACNELRMSEQTGGRHVVSP